MDVELDLDVLVAVAEAAFSDGDGDWFPPEVLTHAFGHDDAEFIAAVSPAVVLGLVRRLRAAEGALAATRIGYVRKEVPVSD